MTIAGFLRSVRVLPRSAWPPRSSWLVRRAAAAVLLLAAAASMVPVLARAAAAPGRPETAVSVADPIDLNQASAAELSLLPGVGPSLAAAIVADRESRGPFRRPQDIDRVRGIGPSILARILPHVTVGAPATAYAAH
jgi:competence protein ComEA